MLQFESEVLSDRPLAPSWRELTLAWDPRAGRPRPGTFLTLRVPDAGDPLLRRPFAFASYRDLPGGGAEAGIVYQVRGPGTRLLAAQGRGAAIDILGPLGRPFPLPEPAERAILVAGGIGLGPILFFSSVLPASILVAGFRRAADLPDLPFPEGTVLTTDDGSAGRAGTPLDWLRAADLGPGVRVYGCGPAPLLAALADLCGERAWEASLSAEQWMACGLGACMGCVLPRAGGGFLRACADGPVFGRDEIDWAAEARRLALPPRRPA